MQKIPIVTSFYSWETKAFTNLTDNVARMCVARKSTQYSLSDIRNAEQEHHWE